MDEQNEQVSTTFPKMNCGTCSGPMTVIGRGSASGRLRYRCPACGIEVWGKNPEAVALGSRGGKATFASLSPEERRKIAEKAGNANAERIREKKRNQRLI